MSAVALLKDRAALTTRGEGTDEWQHLPRGAYANIVTAISTGAEHA